MKNKHNSKCRKLLYHISDVDNISSILESGLKLNEDGEIFLFEDVNFLNLWTDFEEGKVYLVEQRVANNIALNQIGLANYAMFEINVDGLTLEPDNVAEITARHQYICREAIGQERVKLFGVFDALKEEIKKIKIMGSISNSPESINQ